MNKRTLISSFAGTTIFLIALDAKCGELYSVLGAILAIIGVYLFLGRK